MPTDPVSRRAFRRGTATTSAARGTASLRAAVVVAVAATALLAPTVTATASTGNDTPGQSTAVAQSARSTKVTVVNGTTTTMYRNYTSLSHGVWDDATPPEKIDGGASAAWGSHSSGMMTGTEGYARYAVGTDGEISIHWNNPYAGGNGYSCDVPAGYSCSRSGGGGNNAEVTFTIGRNGVRAATPASGFSTTGAGARNATSAAAAARSTHVTLQNRTPNEMVRTSSSLSHGTWSDNMVPPDRVFPMSNGTWQSESNGFMTGTQGSAVYNMYEVGNVAIHWNNPYSGSNKYACDVPSGFTCRQDGGGGDNAAVTFTVSKG
ncbi:Crystal protein ET79 [Streptomyces sp. LN699]|uniref:Crystal protein ET79 n=1 Tax=Streptomyces sp. LN699 TaxID=3112981 RepID=UPI00372207AD